MNNRRGNQCPYHGADLDMLAITNWNDKTFVSFEANLRVGYSSVFYYSEIENATKNTEYEQAGIHQNNGRCQYMRYMDIWKRNGNDGGW